MYRQVLGSEYKLKSFKYTVNTIDETSIQYANNTDGDSQMDENTFMLDESGINETDNEDV